MCLVSLTPGIRRTPAAFEHHRVSPPPEGEDEG